MMGTFYHNVRMQELTPERCAKMNVEGWRMIDTYDERPDIIQATVNTFTMNPDGSLYSATSTSPYIVIRFKRQAEIEG